MDWFSKDPEIHYVHSVNTFLKQYNNWINQTDTCILGDFNSNLTYDLKKSKPHQTMLNMMNELNLVSAYHKYFNEDQGKESQATFYYHKKNNESKQHIDYIFIPSKLSNNIKKIEVGIFDEWYTYSDHMPIIMDIDYL
jgi:endonuclease/exonuclease/phosphatase family metal-dependent hydrolase